MSIFSLFRRQRKIPVLLEQSARNVLEIARQLKDLVAIWEDVPQRVGLINDLEKEGDAITHLIGRELYRNYMTQFDLEDIVSLANSLDDVADFIYTAADDMLLYKVDRPAKGTTELAEIITQTAAEVDAAVSEIHGRINQKQILERCREIHRLENAADGIYRLALSELFANTINMTHSIKWLEIFNHMESAIDKCEDIANILEGISIKYC